MNEDGISDHNADEMLAHFTRDICLDDAPSKFIWKFYFKNGSGKGFHNNAFNLYIVFFWHTGCGETGFLRKIKPAYCMKNTGSCK